jgi:hypothetical protein
MADEEGGARPGGDFFKFRHSKLQALQTFMTFICSLVKASMYFWNNMQLNAYRKKSER